MRLLSTKIIYLLSAFISILFAGILIHEGVKTREKLTDEYFKHKKFMFQIKNITHGPKKHATEKEVRSLLERHKINIGSIYSGETGIEVKAENVYWGIIPYLVRDLERNYTIVQFSAVDNTGKGMFDVRIVVR